MGLEKFTDAELHEEIRHREELALAKEAILHNFQREWLLKNVDAMLEIVPEHDRTSCYDEHVINGYATTEGGIARCARCALLTVKTDGYNCQYRIESIKIVCG
jgi:hypothetical protein